MTTFTTPQLTAISPIDGSTMEVPVATILKKDSGQWKALLADLTSDKELAEDRIDFAAEAVAKMTAGTEASRDDTANSDGQRNYDAKVLALLDWTSDLLAAKRQALYSDNIAGLYEAGYDEEEIAAFGYEPEMVDEVLAAIG